MNTRLVNSTIKNNHVIHFCGLLNSTSIHNITTAIFSAIKAKAEQIDFIFSSDGGDISNAILLSNLIHSSPIPIRMINFSSVESASVLVYLAASERIVSPNATFLVHSISQYFNAQWYEHNKVKEHSVILNHLADSYIEHYKKYTVDAKKPLDIENILHGSAIIINASDSIDYGIAKEILHPENLSLVYTDHWCLPPK